MKTLTKILFFFLLMMQICFAQWIYQSPIPTLGTPHDVYFIDTNTGWVVAETIFKTTDGGNNWVKQYEGWEDFEGVFFNNENTGWAVTGFGSILKTTDGGNNWLRLNYKDEYALHDVYFIDDNTGWIVGGNKILKTTDGGKNWITTQGRGGFELFFVDANRGWAVGGNSIHRTIDGGQSWVTQLFDSNIWLRGTFFINANTGWAAGVDDILKTTDGGENWIPQFIDTIPIISLTSVCFTDSNRGFVVGSGMNGGINEVLILRTTNGGNNWVKHFTRIAGGWTGLSSVCFPNANVGIAVGDGPIILRTEDGGENWFNQVKGTHYQLNGIASIDANTATAVGCYGTIMRTTNGGKSWIRQSSGTQYDLSAVYFTDLNTGVAVGGAGEWNSIILRTTDGGNYWANQFEDSTYQFNGVYFIDANIGWAVGGDRILKTIDGGEHWFNQLKDSTYGFYDWQHINAIYFTDANNGTVVGGGGHATYEGIILRTTNGGDSWVKQTSGTPYALNSVFFTSSTTGWIVGGDWACGGGIILMTTDGGAKWITQLSSTNYQLNSVYFSSSAIGWAVGDPWSIGGIILTTADGGNSWTEQTDATLGALNSVSFASSTTGWVVGANGTILKTTNGGVVPVELITFTASANGKEVTLSWSTATELNNQGFEVQRKFSSNDFITVGSVKGHGTTTSPKNYTYIDKLADAGKYFYRLKQIDFGGKYEYSQTVEVNWSPFTTYKLEQNYPNPFNPTTTIGYGIPASPNPSDLSRRGKASTEGGAFVTLKVYDILGNEVKTLVNKEMEAGYHSVDFDASELPSGVFFYRLQAGNYVETKKMILLR